MFVMKITLLLLVVCLTQIYASPEDNRILMECFQENGITKEILQEPNMTEEKARKRLIDRFGCISVCYLKKQLVDPTPIRKHIVDSLNEPRPAFTDSEIAKYKNEVNNCIEEAKTDDCKLMQCLNPWSSQTRLGEIIGIPHINY